MISPSEDKKKLKNKRTKKKEKEWRNEKKMWRKKRTKNGKKRIMRHRGINLCTSVHIKIGAHFFCLYHTSWWSICGYVTIACWHMANAVTSEVIEICSCFKMILSYPIIDRLKPLKSSTIKMDILKDHVISFFLCPGVPLFQFSN